MFAIKDPFTGKVYPYTAESAVEAIAEMHYDLCENEAMDSGEDMIALPEFLCLVVLATRERYVEIPLGAGGSIAIRPPREFLEVPESTVRYYADKVYRKNRP